MVFDKGLYQPPQNDAVKLNFSFAGCGFLGIYHVGVASCIREYAPHLVTEKIAGASAGAIAAVGLICNSDLGNATTQVLEVALKARSYTLGPLHPTFSIVKFVEGLLDEYLPYNAHELSSGRLFISLTRMHDRKNVLVSQFDTRDDLIQALICSAYIPFYCGLFPPQYKGTYYLDGGLSNNIPILDEHTITVSPFAGESDICPSDNSSCDLHVYLANTSIQLSTSNLYRFGCIMFPPSPEILSKMCQQGFDDCLVFLQRANLISCKRHLSIYTSLTTDSHYPEEEDKDYQDSTAYTTDEGVSTSTEDEIDPVLELSFNSSSLSSSCESLLSHCDGNDGDDEMEEICNDCKHRQHVAVLDSLPPQVVTALQAACDSVNHTILGRLYKFKMLRVLGVMATPWVIPAELVYSLTRRFFQWAPQMPADMQWFVKEFYMMVKDSYAFIQASRHRYSARLTCQLAITDLDFPSDSTRHSLPNFNPRISSSHSHQPSKPSPATQRRSINLGFSMDFKHKGSSAHEDPMECITEFRQQILEQKTQRLELAELKSDIEESNTRLEHVFVDDHGKKHVHLSKVSKLSSKGAGGGGGGGHNGGSPRHRHHSGGAGPHGGSSKVAKVDPAGLQERRGSVERNSISNDTFDNCLHFAQQMDSILTYHYTSEDDPQTVRVAEIYSLDDPSGPVPETTVSDMSLAWDSFMEMKQEHSSGSHDSRKSRSKSSRLFNEIEEETILGVGETMSSMEEQMEPSEGSGGLLTCPETPQNPSLQALREVSRISREVHFSEPESIVCESPGLNVSQHQQLESASELSPIVGDNTGSSRTGGEETELYIVETDHESNGDFITSSPSFKGEDQ